MRGWWLWPAQRHATPKPCSQDPPFADRPTQQTPSSKTSDLCSNNNMPHPDRNHPLHMRLLSACLDERFSQKGNRKEKKNNVLEPRR